VAAHTQHREQLDRHYLTLGAVFLVLLAALGGASRADELQQFFVRLAAIGAIAAAAWPLRSSAWRDARVPATGIALVYLLILAQLIPLPPSLWSRMPGHAIYRQVEQQTGAVAWRPWTLSPDLTLNALGALLPATAVGLIALSLDFHGRLVLMRLVVAIACVSALLGLMQFAAGGTTLHLFRTTNEDSAVGLFANRNHQAVLMACALPLLAAIASIHMHQQEHSRRHFAISIGAAVLLLMGLGATGSRMGLLLGSLGLIAASIIHVATMPRIGDSRQRKLRFWVARAGLAAAALLPVSLLISRSGALARLMSDPVDQTRTAALAPMIHAAWIFFPFGAGFGTFDPVYRTVEPDSLLSTIYLNQAHNEPVQLAIEGGLPALLLLLLFLVWWLRAAMRAVRPRDSNPRRALAIAMTATTVILMLSSLVDYPLRTPLLSGIFALACIELVRANRRADASRAQ
jgi:O-antigen ligase